MKHSLPSLLSSFFAVIVGALILYSPTVQAHHLNPDAPASEETFAPAPEEKPETDSDMGDHTSTVNPEAKEPQKEKKKPAKKKAPVTSWGYQDGKFYIGQRTKIDRYEGWGWVREDNKPWRTAKWCFLEEKYGEGTSPAPGKFLPRHKGDENIKYKLWGYWADYDAYEPNKDVWVPVFVLKGFKKIGPSPRIKRKPPRYKQSSGGGTIGERGANWRFRDDD